MAGTTESVTVHDKEVRDLFKRLIKRVSNLKPTMEVIGELLKTSVVENFEAGGRPDKWTPLSPETIKKKRNKNKVLIEEGHLLDSINHKAFSDRVEIGTNKVYAAIHQFGGYAGVGKKVFIPERPFLVIHDEDMEEVRKMLLRHILN